MINFKKSSPWTYRGINTRLFVHYWQSGMLINKANLVLNHKSFVKLLDLSESYSPICKIRIIISIFSKCNVLNCKIYLKCLVKCLTQCRATISYNAILKFKTPPKKVFLALFLIAHLVKNLTWPELLLLPNLSSDDVRLFTVCKFLNPT